MVFVKDGRAMPDHNQLSGLAGASAVGRHDVDAARARTGVQAEKGNLSSNRVVDLRLAKPTSRALPYRFRS